MLFCLLALIVVPAMGAGQQVSLTIFHTNDTHGHLLPFSYPASDDSGDLSGLRERTNIGGIARRAALVKSLRAELERKGSAVWLVDAGDFTDGTSFSTEYRGEADVDAMNAAGYTFGTIGNHELNASLATLKKLIGMVRFPLLCANLTENATGKSLVAPSAIRKLGAMKIGVFGLTSPSAGNYPAAKGQLTIGGEIQNARRMAETLRKEADIIILISHAGERMDQQIAESVLGIDVIIGGHSHTRLPAGEFFWRSDELQERWVNGTVIVQAFQWGGELGRLDLLFDKDEKGAWRVVRYRERLIPVTSRIVEDQAVAAVVARYWNPIAARYGEVIGKAAADFVERGSDMAPYNLVADAVREMYGTEIALENMGGVRAPLVKGNITLEDMTQLDPFENTIVTFKITGRQLKDVLSRSKPAVSGIRYRIEGGRLEEAFVGDQPVNDSQVYTGVSNSYMAGNALKSIQTTDTGKVRLQALIEYIRKKGTVHPVYDGRRVIID